MTDRTRVYYPHGLNKRFHSKFYPDSRVWQNIPADGWRSHRLKHCANNTHDEVSSPKNPNNESLFKKFRNIKSCSEASISWSRYKMYFNILTKLRKYFSFNRWRSPSKLLIVIKRNEYLFGNTYAPHHTANLFP